MSGAPVLVVGTGALGCAFAGWMGRAGLDVTMAGSWRAAIEALAARGVAVEEDAARWSAPVHAALVEAVRGPFAHALVLVKSGGTDRAASLLSRALAPEGLAITLQNGLGNRERLADALGEMRVIAGVAFIGALVVRPGEVRVTSGSRVVLDGSHERAGEAAALLQRTGIAVEAAAPFAPACWTKLAVNCAVNAPSALRGVLNGALLEDADCRQEMAAAAREVAAVAAARGVALPGDAAERAFAVARATAANRSSMLQDLERGAATEVEALNGAVAAEGRRLGIPTPVNDRLLLRMREREGRR